ncbi:MAG TPA: CYTH domain-containing protein [Planctomycetota bacterium]|nr:CYTH domain-containing protein [Planctomycetota bacterium]
MKEIEARFVTSDPSVFDRLLAYQRLGSYEVRFRERQLLVTDYLDTERWDLLKARSALRLCRRGRDCSVCLQTLCKRSGMVEVRDEFEEPLPDGYPARIDTLSCGVMDRVRKLTRERPLLVVLTIENNRTILDLVRGGGKCFEMVLDDVEFVNACDQRRHFEVEIECCTGDQFELEALLGIIGSGFELEQSRESKFERGLRLTRSWPAGLKW